MFRQIISALFVRERYFITIPAFSGRGSKRYEITTNRRDDTMHPVVALEMANAMGLLGRRIEIRRS